LPLLDPQGEIAGTRDAIRAGLISRSEAVRRSGWSSEQIDQENAKDNARADQLGLVYDSDPRRVSQQGQQQQQQVFEEVQE
jgi:capsid protein